MESIDELVTNSQEDRSPSSVHSSTSMTAHLPGGRAHPNNQPESPQKALSTSKLNRTRKYDMESVPESEVESSSSESEHTTAISSSPSAGMVKRNNFTDFFSSEVMHIVLHNPTTSHRLLRFCQSRACGEDMEFLQKINQYNRLLDETSQLIGKIHSTFTSADAPRQIDISNSVRKRVSSDIRQASQSVLPGLENIFLQAQETAERRLATDVYPRFVKHQVTASATMALADHRERFEGLGDCFCMTDPSIADNPILYASDGFVSVTGYNRKDIIPRNCRFLQGELTDPQSPKRLKAAIKKCDETVELLLNYRKNGDPFWNLLYVSPLFNERGEVAFFLGGQINCSTTIHSCNDILRVLSINDDEIDQVDEMTTNIRPPSVRTRDSTHNVPKVKSSFFKSWRKYSPTSTRPPTAEKVVVKDQAGMEPGLIDKLGKMSFSTQVEAFYTAYSKYIVMEWAPQRQSLTIKHYSTGIIDMLCLNLPNGGIAPIYSKDIFKVLSEHTSSPSSSSSKTFKQTVREALVKGKAVSVEIGLLTGFAERKGSAGWFGSDREGGMKRIEEKYITHWTPLKDEEGRVKWTVLSIAPKG